MIEEGQYTARAVGFSFHEAKSGTKLIRVRFRIESGIEVEWTGFFTPDTAERTVDSLLYAGWVGGDLATLEGLGSTQVKIDVQHEEYNGRVYPRARWVNPLVGRAVLDPVALESLSARCAGLAAKRKQDLQADLEANAEASEAPPKPADNGQFDSPPPTDGDAFGEEDMPF